jgi:hypothetical protein
MVHQESGARGLRYATTMTHPLHRESSDDPATSSLSVHRDSPFVYRDSPNSMLRLGAVLVACLALPAPTAAQVSWTHTKTPASGKNRYILRGVEGRSGADVWTVGERMEPDFRIPRIHTLALRYDGKVWRTVPTPDPHTTPSGRPMYNVLHEVTALANGRAVAVGQSQDSRWVGQLMAMEWDGKTWKTIKTPSFRGGSGFFSVTQTPSGSVWACGTATNLTSTPPRLEAILAQRTSSGWTILHAPVVGVRKNLFHGVAARSNKEVWVVGTRGKTLGDFHILLQRYNGSGWTTFKVPSPGALDSLEGVAAIASNNVWAAGFWYPTKVGRFQPLLMHFDGTTWRQQALPTFAGSTQLSDIVANSATDIYACGSYANTSRVPQPFMLHFDGKKWSQTIMPKTGGSQEWFRAVGRSSSGQVWAVGQYYDGTRTAPLAMRGDSPGFYPYDSGMLKLVGTGTPRAGLSVGLVSSGAASGPGLMVFSLDRASFRYASVQMSVGLGRAALIPGRFDGAGRWTLPISLPKPLPLGEVFVQTLGLSSSRQLVGSNGLRVVVGR